MRANDQIITIDVELGLKKIAKLPVIDTKERPRPWWEKLAYAVLMQAVKDAKREGKDGDDARAFLNGSEDCVFWKRIGGFPT